MKYLKIENNKGSYRLDTSKDIWTDIDQINKDHLLELIKLASENEFEMDEYNDELLKNPAHNIIYKNIYNKFSDFLKNKTRFQDSAESTYKQAIEKYQLK
ncbi:MAG: hypothetical protein Fur0028_03580 [Bacteroidales bacterium]